MNQVEAYKKYIEPNMSHLLSLTLSARRRVDQVFWGVIQKHWTTNDDSPVQDGVKNTLLYPNGHCKEIRDKVYAIIMDEEPWYLSHFLADGGELRKRWLGVYRWGKWVGFANVITIWDSVLDPAYEELSDNTVPIHITEIWDTYRTVDLTWLKEISETYHHRTMFTAQSVLGRFAIYLPFLALEKWGYLEILPSTYDIPNHFDSKWKEAVKYLKNQDTGVPEVIKHNLLETIRTLEVPWERLYLRDALGFWTIDDNEIIQLMDFMRTTILGWGEDITQKLYKELKIESAIEFSILTARYHHLLTFIMRVHNFLQLKEQREKNLHRVIDQADASLDYSS